MKYLHLTTTNPYRNLALEEYLFRHTEEEVLLLWQNEPTVVIGKNQNAYAEVDLTYAEEHGIHVSRRITGGGAVYHDLGNINYSLITSEQSTDGPDYVRFTRPILDALCELGLSCELSGRNDLVCEGRKISGNAQYTANGRTLHHGTLLFDTDLSVLSRVLRIDKEKLAYRGIKSYRSRVANLSALLDRQIDVNGFTDHLERFLCAQLATEPMESPTDPRLDALTTRNESKEWILSDRRYLTSYTVLRKKKYPFGLVQVEMELRENRIEAIRFTGDFFGMTPIEMLEEKLIGQSLDAPSFTDPSPYIGGMTAEEFAQLLKG